MYRQLREASRNYLKRWLSRNDKRDPADYKVQPRHPIRIRGRHARLAPLASAVIMARGTAPSERPASFLSAERRDHGRAEL
ncbi:unnamed protein product, partial [Iphiclides podalirius]